jgi:hypothetical protein
LSFLFNNKRHLINYKNISLNQYFSNHTKFIKSDQDFLNKLEIKLRNNENIEFKKTFGTVDKIYHDEIINLLIKYKSNISTNSTRYISSFVFNLSKMGLSMKITKNQNFIKMIILDVLSKKDLSYMDFSTNLNGISKFILQINLLKIKYLKIFNS